MYVGVPERGEGGGGEGGRAKRGGVPRLGLVVQCGKFTFRGFESFMTQYTTCSLCEVENYESCACWSS